MFKKRTKTLMAVCLAAVMTLTSLPAAPLVTRAAGEPANLALNKEASSSENETADYTAPKAVDGDMNREAPKPQSRWATKPHSDQQPMWLKVDLGEKKTFQSFLIAWERTNIQHYKIQISDTGEDNAWTDVYDKPDDSNIASLDEIIRLENAATARFVRLYVDKYALNPGNWQSVSVYEFQVYEDAVPTDTLSAENYHLAGTAEVSNYEETEDEPGKQNAAKAIDGDQDTRWATEPSDTKEPRVLTVTLPKPQFIKYFRIFWERTNIESYKIEVSENGTDYTEVYKKTTPITDTKELIELETGAWAKYTRLTVDGYNGGNNNWPNVSLAEFEAYAKYPEISADATAKEIADSLAAPIVNADVSALIFPETPDGVKVEFNADYEQVVAKDGTIHRPLTDKTIVGIYKVTKGEETAESFHEHTIVIPGIHKDAGVNAKPVVIPELAEWYGGETAGTFNVNADTKILYDNEATGKAAAEAFAADFEAETGIHLTPEQGNKQNGAIFFTASDDTMLGAEGYTIEIGGDVTVKAADAKGAYWATRSMLQILKRNENTMPFGMTRDYPKYEVRSFSIDVARKPISMSTLQDMAKYMAYYKMNDFQIHLNDNFIFYEDYASVEDAMAKAYTGFRLESDIKAGQVVEGDSKGVANAEDLTNEDLFYTKADFRQFILDCRAMGIGVVPEFDAPGHSGAFMDVRPDLHLKATIEGQAKRAGEQFDLSDEHYADSLNFVEKLWDEYLNEDMFDSSVIVHVGTDEYYGAAAGFRKFSRDIINHVQEKNPVVRMWGSLSHKPGETAVPSENVQMNMWNNPYAQPMDMYNQGYGLINTQDSPLYIVPAAGYYNDYLNSNNLYTNWQPNAIGNVTIPAASDQMLGATYAVWNDSIDKRANGISEVDIYDRFADAVPAFASKTWGDAKDITHDAMRKAAAELSDAPGTNPYSRADAKDGEYMNYKFTKNAETKDSSANGRDLAAQNNVTFTDNALQLKGKESYVSTPIDKLAAGNTLEFDIKATKALQPGAILFEADTEGNEDYSHDIRIMDDGTLGFTRELYDYSFGYTLPVNEKVHLAISTDGVKTTLYVNGSAYQATGKYVDKGIDKKTGIDKATLLLPLQRIGSKTNAAECIIDNVTVTAGAYKDKTIIDPAAFTVTSDNENPSANGGKEGPVSLAFDGDESTHWHSNYSSYQPLPASVEIDMNTVYKVNKLSYLPRQSGTRNGDILKYSLYYKLNAEDEWKPLITEGTWEAGASLKTAEFDAVEARYIKLTALEGTGNATQQFAAAAEIRVHKVWEDEDDQEETKPAVYTAYVDGKAYKSGEYNTKVELHAAAQKEGQDFVCWMAGDSADTMKPISTKKDYMFFLANDIYLTAAYEQTEETTLKPKAEITSTLKLQNESDPAKIDARFVAQLTVPEGTKLVEAGLYWDNKDGAPLSEKNTPKTTKITKISTSYQYSVTIKGVPKGRFVRGIVFAKYQLPNGETGYQASEIMISNPEKKIAND